MNRSEKYMSYSADLMFLEKGVLVRASLCDGIKWSTLSISHRGIDFAREVMSLTKILHMQLNHEESGMEQF